MGYGSRLYHQTFVFCYIWANAITSAYYHSDRKTKTVDYEIFSTGNLEFRISYYTFAPENERFTRTRKLKSE